MPDGQGHDRAQWMHDDRCWTRLLVVADFVSPSPDRSGDCGQTGQQGITAVISRPYLDMSCFSPQGDI
jgi:hypothetical protein